ncbi:MAG: hypothetical protein AAB225_12010, partial [Acidobacteriota bacterium]
METFQVDAAFGNTGGGDFSQLLSAGGIYQIYGPLTGAREGSRVCRPLLPTNVIPRSRLNPIALNYLKFYTGPNQAGRADGRDNFLANTTRTEDFNSELGRLDFNLSDRHTFFFNFRHNERLQLRGDRFKNIATGNFLSRVNWGAMLDDVYTFSPTTVLNTRFNWTRFTEGGTRPSLGFDLTSLGFPASLAAASSQAVLRAGIGVYYFTEGLIPSQQPGYFQRTPLVATLDGYLTPAATLSNPFPNGILAPVGNSLGINTFLGQSVTFYNPSVDNPYSVRWNLSIQRELSRNLLVEAGYMGNHAVRLTGNRGLNWAPRQFFSTAPFRDQPVIDRMTANVTNPFTGLMPGTALDGRTVAVAQLLQPYPQFSGDGGVAINTDNFGSSYFHMFQARLEKRHAGGFAYLVNYQYSRLMEKRSFLNPSDLTPEKRVAGEDRPHR